MPSRYGERNSARLAEANAKAKATYQPMTIDRLRQSDPRLADMSDEELRASWQHEYLYSALPIDAQFASGAGSVFTVRGPAEGHDSALLDAGVDVRWTPAIGTYFGYNGNVGRSNYDSNSVICSVHVDF